MNRCQQRQAFRGGNLQNSKFPLPQTLINRGMRSRSSPAGLVERQPPRRQAMESVAMTKPQELRSERGRCPTEARSPKSSSNPERRLSAAPVAANSRAGRPTATRAARHAPGYPAAAERLVAGAGPLRTGGSQAGEGQDGFARVKQHLRPFLPPVARPATGESSCTPMTTGQSFRRRPTSCLRSTDTASDGILCHGADRSQEERFQGRSVPTRKHPASSVPRKLLGTAMSGPHRARPAPARTFSASSVFANWRDRHEPERPGECRDEY